MLSNEEVEGGRERDKKGRIVARKMRKREIGDRTSRLGEGLIMVNDLQSIISLKMRR